MMFTDSEILNIKQRFGIIGNSPLLNHAIQVAMQAAPTDMTVLITSVPESEDVIKKVAMRTVATVAATFKMMSGAAIVASVGVTALIAARPDLSVEAAAMEVLPQLEGAFSLVFMDEHSLYAARDRHGFRPLVLGRHRTQVPAVGERAHVPGEVVAAVDLDADGDRAAGHRGPTGHHVHDRRHALPRRRCPRWPGARADRTDRPDRDLGPGPPADRRRTQPPAVVIGDALSG